MGVLSHQAFERDGKKWLHFAVQDPDSDVAVRFERPLLRIASIKRHGAEAMDRPVVSLIKKNTLSTGFPSSLQPGCW